MSGSAVRSFTVALQALFDAAKPAGWEVLGRRPFDPTSMKFLAVGWSGSEFTPSIQVPQRQPSNAFGDQQQETVNVLCLLSAWDGSTDPEQELFDAFDAFDAALNADLRVGGTAMTARISTFDYTPVKVAEGHGGQLQFIVTALTQK